MHRALRIGIFLVVILFTCWLAGLFDTTNAQRRTRRRTPPAQQRKPSIDYSRFSHFTAKHQAACNTCHKIPSTNWQKVSGFPDITDYPDHDACVSCHRQQFFRGARPVICSNCHVKVSPRDEARFEFRNPASERQFAIEFPHDKHQDVIARNRLFNSERQVVFVRASFKMPLYAEREFSAPDDKTYNNCTICHSARQDGPTPPTGGWVDSFVPPAGTFKSVPTGHASCFNCHWKAQVPVNDDCKGCHRLDKPSAPVQVVRRLSMKFTHAREQHIDECTTCHINITKSSSARGLNPDVPITSCTGCHNQVGKREDLDAELAKLGKDKDFVCTYCHTSDKGRLDPPASHYLITGRKPITRAEIR